MYMYVECYVYSTSVLLVGFRYECAWLVDGDVHYIATEMTKVQVQVVTYCTESTGHSEGRG
jgi:hypothetical protein